MNPNGTYKNPLFALYKDMAAAAEPELRRAGTGADQQLLPGRHAEPGDRAVTYGGRVDYNHSGNDRFFFRASGTTFYE